MRVPVVLLLIGVSSFVAARNLSNSEFKIEDEQHLRKQKNVLDLFNHIEQPTVNKEFVKIYNNFRFDIDWKRWSEPQYAEEFWSYHQNELLPKGQVFCVFYPEHLKQAVALFRTLYYTKDYETFLEIAVWARQTVNEGMFVYALSVALVHSQWGHGIIIPPIYEIFPHFFFNYKVINKAQLYKNQYDQKDIRKSSNKEYTLQANYSKQSMSYFTEDIGINSHYNYYHILRPFWMKSDEAAHGLLKYRGNHFFWFHQQLLARYYLERLSNGQGKIAQFEYEYPIEIGYDPSLAYPNGLHFPVRPNQASLHFFGQHDEKSYLWYGNYTYSYGYVKNYEMRLRDVLDKGFFYTQEGKRVFLYNEEGLEILGNLVECNADSYNSRYYGDLLIFARHLLGYSYFRLDQLKLTPSALEHYTTSMRDPMFYALFKRILYYYYQYQNHVRPYELHFDNVQIEDVTIDPLITYFDYFYSDLGNSIPHEPNEHLLGKFNVRARQYRLNHKPFTYKIFANSDKNIDVFFKVFIGPKYDQNGNAIKIKENRKNFFEIDRFKASLQNGKNQVTRNSLDIPYFSKDADSFNELYNKIIDARDGQMQFKVLYHMKYYGFPHRLLLPKGKVNGQRFQLYVLATPYREPEDTSNFYYVDTQHSLGYPFDRLTDFDYEFYDSNSYFKDIVIYHKHINDVFNTTKS